MFITNTQYLAVAVSLLSLFAGQRLSQTQPVSLAWSLINKDVSLYEPVVIRLAVENRSGKVATMDLGLNRKAGFELSVFRDGALMRQITNVTVSGFGASGTIHIEPNHQFVCTAILDEQYALDTAGDYSVDVRLVNPVLVGDEIIPLDTSAKLRFTITPPDEGRLRKTCEALIAELSSAHDPWEAQQATNALSFVRDPIVIPYLEQAIAATSAPLARQTAIRAFGRFSSPEAVRVLLERLEASKHDAFARMDLFAVKQTLSRLSSRVADVATRNRIQAALADAQP